MATNNKFELYKNRINWLNNWNRVFELWRWSPGFLYIKEFLTYIPKYFLVNNYLGSSMVDSRLNYFRLNDTERDQVDNDSKANCQTQDLLFGNKSSEERKSSRFLNCYYLMAAFNIESHPFLNGKYAWQSNLINAHFVIDEAFKHKSTYDLLLNHFFVDDLNLHKSANSLIAQNSDYTEDYIPIVSIEGSDFYKSTKTQKQYFNELAMSAWDYDKFVVSAICFVLGSIYREGKLKGSICSVLLSGELYRLNPYLVCPIFSEQLYSVLVDINLFGYDPFLGLRNFKDFLARIDGAGSNLKSDENKSDKFLFLNKIAVNYCKLFNLSFITPDSFFQGILDNMPLKLTEPQGCPIPVNTKLSELKYFQGNSFFSQENIGTKLGIVEHSEITKTFLPVFHAYDNFLKLCSIWYKSGDTNVYEYFLDTKDKNNTYQQHKNNTYQQQLQFLTGKSYLDNIQDNILRSDKPEQDFKFKNEYNYIIFVAVFLKNYCEAGKNPDGINSKTSNSDSDKLIQEYLWLKSELTKIFPSLNIEDLFVNAIDKIQILKIK